MNWNDLSRYRAPLMGFAMIIVMLFHVPLSRSDAFYGLMRCGNNGVDMFLFLSGIGLWYSWTKPSSESSFWEKLRKFYFRRFLRLYPAWLIIASLYYIPQYWPNGGGYSPNLFHLIANILVGWSFWRIDDLTFWFVPAIMALYLIAPFYMRLIQRDRIWRWLPLVTILWYLLVRDWPPLWKSVGYVEIFWSRIPVFLLGINAGELVKAPLNPPSRGKDSSLFTLHSSLFFLLSLWYCVYVEGHRHGAFPPAAERMVYIPLAVSAMFLMCKVFRHAPSWLLRAFTFVGGISLEIYLIHIQFVLVYVKPYHLGYWPTFLLMLAFSIPLAWLLSKLVSLLIKPLKK
jgi:peptidoglycan/LPS O-acetylase OafA/YrhL